VPWRACAGLALHDLVLAGATGEGLLIGAQSTALRHALLPGGTRCLSARVLIVGSVVGFGYYLPKVGLAVSAISGVVLWIWYIAITRSFLKLGRSTRERLGRGLEPDQ
jgi:hypothetical protein